MAIRIYSPTDCVLESPLLQFLGGGDLVAKLCLTLATPMDYSPPGSSVHGILQARILEWVAISFSNFLPTVFYLFFLVKSHAKHCEVISCSSDLHFPNDQ